MTKNYVLREIIAELEDKQKVSSSLLVLTGMDAIRQNRVELWVLEMYSHVFDGRSWLLDREFKPRMARLIRRYMELN